MPELPEVETTRLGLIDALEGERIVAAKATHPRLLRRQANSADFSRRLTGNTVEKLRRVGKFLMFDVADTFIWVTHLGMSGRMSVDDVGAELSPHTHVIIRTSRGQEVRMVDPRTFGFTAVYTPAEFADSTLALLGPDAWTALPTAKALAARAAGRTIAVKSLLLDQRFLAGLGNIYADEVLHRARIAGTRPADTLSADDFKSIRTAIRPVLKAGLAHGGTSLDDFAYLLPDGRAGDYLSRLRVYGRQDQACRRCGTPIVRTVIGGRSSFSCPNCQV